MKTPIQPTSDSAAETGADAAARSATATPCKINEASPPLPTPRPPVTIISGFLGAGKTTLLQHLLTGANAGPNADTSDGSGPRWAAIVNDLAALNIDGRLIEQAGASRVVELANGCVCCTVRDALAETVAELAASGRYTHLFVETSGVAEPRAIVGLFTRPNAFGRTLSDFAQLHALVTVVDAAQWRAAWRRIAQSPTATLSETTALFAGLTESRRSGEPKAPSELMLEQIECADLLLLNKADLVSVEELGELEAALRGLNTRAEILTTREARVPPGLLPGEPRFDLQATLGAARWLKVLEAAEGGNGANSIFNPDEIPTGSRKIKRTSPWQTFVFRERAPFSEARLRAFFAEKRPLGLIRAKGFFWVKERAADMGYLSLAGEVLRSDFVGNWAAALLERGLVTREEIPEHARALWAEPYGDRRQELVFIGQGLDTAALEFALRDCLAS